MSRMPRRTPNVNISRLKRTPKVRVNQTNIDSVAEKIASRSNKTKIVMTNNLKQRGIRGSKIAKTGLNMHIKKSGKVQVIKRKCIIDLPQNPDIDIIPPPKKPKSK